MVEILKKTKAQIEQIEKTFFDIRDDITCEEYESVYKLAHELKEEMLDLIDHYERFENDNSENKDEIKGGENDGLTFGQTFKNYIQQSSKNITDPQLIHAMKLIFKAFTGDKNLNALKTSMLAVIDKQP